MASSECDHEVHLRFGAESAHEPGAWSTPAQPEGREKQYVLSIASKGHFYIAHLGREYPRKMIRSEEQ
jgi:hypothetical protein